MHVFGKKAYSMSLWSQVDNMHFWIEKLLIKDENSYKIKQRKTFKNQNKLFFPLKYFIYSS